MREIIAIKENGTIICNREEAQYQLNEIGHCEIKKEEDVYSVKPTFKNRERYKRVLRD